MKAFASLPTEPPERGQGASRSRRPRLDSQLSSLGLWASNLTSELQLPHL